MQNKTNTTRVIAIDPGYERIGIAVVEKKSREKEVLLFSECFKTSAKLSHDKRLALLGGEIARVIAQYSPTDMAIEELFFNENTTTALKVAEARGVVVYEAANAALEIYEYTPQEIKMAVTGYGRSDKSQVTSMVQKLISIPTKNNSKKIIDDEFDAIAIGLTHCASKQYLSR